MGPLFLPEFAFLRGRCQTLHLGQLPADLDQFLFHLSERLPPIRRTFNKPALLSPKAILNGSNLGPHASR